jgi:hypothetical protein
VGFHQFVKLIAIVLWSAGAITGAGNNVTIRIKNQDCGEVSNFVFVSQLVVLLLKLGGQLPFMWEIKLDKDELLGSLSHERILIEYFVLELLTPCAPVRTGEINEQEFLLCLGFDLRGVKVGSPICGSNRSCTGESCIEAQSRYLSRQPTQKLTHGN